MIERMIIPLRSSPHPYRPFQRLLAHHFLFLLVWFSLTALITIVSYITSCHDRSLCCVGGCISHVWVYVCVQVGWGGHSQSMGVGAATSYISFVSVVFLLPTCSYKNQLIGVKIGLHQYFCIFYHNQIKKHRKCRFLQVNLFSYVNLPVT